MSDASYDRMREALRHLLKPLDERLADARALEGPVRGLPPAWLDDKVLRRCHAKGFIADREVASYDEIPPGHNVVSKGDGRYYIVEVTDAGRAFAAAN